MRSRLHLFRIPMRSCLRFCFACLFLLAPLVQADTADLTTPLDLQQAIAVGTAEFQPALFAVRARQESRRADIQRAESGYALEADINLEAARIEPSATASNQSSNDSRASLNIRKPLYDFGYTGSRVEAAETSAEAERLEYEHVLAQQQLAIASRFFSALLSDVKFSWDNEAMAMLYVRVDRTRDRFALKQVSEIELLKAETDYRQMLTVRRNTELSQRITRAQLAEVINRPGELSATLVAPEIELNDLKLPDPEALIQLAMQTNLELRAQELRVKASQEALDAARKQSRPSLAAEFEVSEYARDLPSREDWRASLNLKIPLFDNTLMQATVADQRALWLQQRAVLSQKQSDVRQQIYDNWMLLNNLLSKGGELETAAQAADRALDKSRGEYELELRTDYGDSLVNTSRVAYEQAKNKFDTIVVAMQLIMLAGQSPRSVIDNRKVSFPMIATGGANEN